MRRLLSSIFLFIFTFTLLLSRSPALTSATAPTSIPLPQGVWYNPTYDEFKIKVLETQPQDQVFGERYTFAQIVWIIHSLALIIQSGLQDQSLNAICQIFSGAPCPGLTGSLPSALAQGVGSLTFSRPVSFVSEASRFLSRFDLASPASAQGYGFEAAAAIRPVWAAMRNSAYLVMILLLVVAGFMIMFRVKISPQAAVSLQLMIPRIIITLLAVTFSYAIVGLIIDLTYLVVAFVIGALAATSSGLISDFPAAIQFFVSPGQFEKLFIYYLTLFISAQLPPLLQVLSGILTFIFGLITIILLLRVWWMLLKNYITLIFIIILGPWMIMLGLLPTSTGFTGWLRNIIAHCAVFAAVPLMFLGNIALFAGGSWSFGGNPSGINPVVFTGGGFPSFPLFSAQGDLFALFAGWAVLALIPKVADMVRDALKVPAFKYGTAFGEALRPAGMLGAPIAGGYALPRAAGRIADMMPEASLGSKVFRGGYQFLEGRFRGLQPMQRDVEG